MRTKRYIGQAFDYFRRTLKNKFYALVLLSIGVIAFGVDRDATVLVFTSAIALPLFFAKDNWIL